MRMEREGNIVVLYLDDIKCGCLFNDGSIHIDNLGCGFYDLKNIVDMFDLFQNDCNVIRWNDAGVHRK